MHLYFSGSMPNGMYSIVLYIGMCIFRNILIMTLIVLQAPIDEKLKKLKQIHFCGLLKTVHFQVSLMNVKVYTVTFRGNKSVQSIKNQLIHFTYHLIILQRVFLSFQVKHEHIFTWLNAFSCRVVHLSPTFVKIEKSK